MTKTEEQLRDALMGVADLVGREVRVPAEQERERRRWSIWFVPAVVAAAVLLVVVAGALTASSLPSSTPVAAGSGSYFAAIVGQGAGPVTHVASIRDAQTGRTLASIRKPKGVAQWTAVTAVGDNRDFYLSGGERSGVARLYRLRVGTRGGVESMTRIRTFSSSSPITQMAVTPDGRRLAVVMAETVTASPSPAEFTPVPESPVATFSDQLLSSPEASTGSPSPGDEASPSGEPSPSGEVPPNGEASPGVAEDDARTAPARIDIVDLGDGRQKTFQATGAGDVENLSWSGDGRRLGYQVNGQRAGIWVLDTQLGGDLFAASRQVNKTEDLPAAPVLSRDGTKIYALTSRFSPELTVGVSEIEVSRGTKLRTLFELRYPRVDMPEAGVLGRIARSADGSSLLVSDNGRLYRLDLTTASGRAPYSILPFEGGAPMALAW